MDHHIKCTTSATRTKSPGFPIHEVVADVFSFRGIANDLLSQATSWKKRMDSKWDNENQRYSNLVEPQEFTVLPRSCLSTQTRFISFP